LPLRKPRRRQKKKTKKATKTPRRLTKAKRFTGDSCRNVLDKVWTFINKANAKYTEFVFLQRISSMREWKEERIDYSGCRSDPYTKREYYIMIIFSYHKRITAKKNPKVVRPR
jgi:hypothetical protein